MISGARRIRKILHQPGATGYTRAGFKSRGFSGTGENPFGLQLEECHYSGMLRDAYDKPIPFHRETGETSVTYLLCGSLRFTNNTGDPGTMTPGNCLWISGTDGREVEFVSTTPPMQEFWSVHVRRKTLIKNGGKNSLNCRIPTAAIPIHRGEDGIIVRVIAGEYQGLRGPLYAQSETALFLDVSIPPLSSFNISIPEKYLVLLYCLEGRGLRDFFSGSLIHNTELVRYSRGEGISLSTGTEEVRLLLIGESGTALTQL